MLKAEIYNQGDSRIVNLTESLRSYLKIIVLRVYPLGNREIPPQPPLSSPEAKRTQTQDKNSEVAMQSRTLPHIA
jgi:hypothetical protein